MSTEYWRSVNHTISTDLTVVAKFLLSAMVDPHFTPEIFSLANAILSINVCTRVSSGLRPLAGEKI